MGEWQPIETSPKDRAILVCERRSQRHNVWFASWREMKRVSSHWYSGGLRVPYNPTHWMDMPEPPR